MKIIWPKKSYLVVEGEHAICWYNLYDSEENQADTYLLRVQGIANIKLYYWPLDEETIRKINKDGIEDFLSEIDETN